jgi:PAS domain S-box-containing protein
LITHPIIHIGNIEYKNNLYVPSNKSLKDNRDKIILKLLIDNVKERTRVDESYFLESVVENIPNMIFIKDAENLRFVKINKAGEKLTGYKRKELIGKNDYDFFPKKEADFFTGKDREVLASKELLDIPEESIHTRRLGTRYLHTKKIPLLNEKGVPEYLLGISEDITDKKIAEEELNLKDSIIEEIHHRVKNNLQVISSFLYLQTDHFSDQHTIKVLTECQNRISAIALIYDHLCRVENVSDIDMGKYIRELSQTFSIAQKSQNQIIQISQSVENVFLEIDKALPCGLILNELLTNSLEHAFSNKKAGEIYIELKQDGKKYSLDVTDNGNGLPKNFNLKRSKSLGLQIVQRLVKQLKGKISVTDDKGTKFNIEFE